VFMTQKCSLALLLWCGGDSIGAVLWLVVHRQCHPHHRGHGMTSMTATTLPARQESNNASITLESFVLAAPPSYSWAGGGSSASSTNRYDQQVNTTTDG